MRSRVMPGSSPTMERRLCVRRLNSVDLPTLGRPTMATRGSPSEPGLLGTTDLRYVGKLRLHNGLPTPRKPRPQNQALFHSKLSACQSLSSKNPDGLICLSCTLRNIQFEEASNAQIRH